MSGEPGGGFGAAGGCLSGAGAGDASGAAARCPFRLTTFSSREAEGVKMLCWVAGGVAKVEPVGVAGATRFDVLRCLSGVSLMTGVMRVRGRLVEK